MNQEQQSGLNVNPYLSNPSFKYNDTIKYFTDVTPSMINVENSLKGFYQDEDGNWIAGGSPLLNTMGVRSLMTWLNNVINTITLQGNIDEKTVKRRCLSYRKQSINLLYCNYYNWGLNKYNMSMIVHMVDHLIFMFMTRPQDDKERDRWLKSFTHTDSTTKIQQERPSRFNLGGGGGGYQ